ncbi:MAG TPA: T9SS type A sorting domain-containing protein [Bacteroidales bacterium]|nr:T9SS type A sorting domain-containing protein [Bacteroidales bacterium]HSA42966.1 T9SS type A sorting domain-containing protein [Bacteroidales bacterium]
MKTLRLFFIIVIVLNFNTIYAQNNINDPFFDQVEYIGAFGTEDWTQGWTNFDPQNTVYPATTITVNGGDMTTNTTWSAGQVYLLNGWVYVKDGVTLTIEPGTIIRGDKTNKGSLIIERGAKLIAQGTAGQPIVFTSNQAAGSRDYGDWGGIIICGRATVNQPGGEATIEGGVGAMYGGAASPDDDDNSGILEYVRVEFPGVAFAPNNEINGITFGGVGRGTTIDYLQVSYCGDDSYEWFGGTVNCKHLVAFRGWDDEFDTDNGFRGMLQFGVALRDPAIADVSGSNGFESDNDASGSGNTPFTQPLFSNFSFFGPLATPTTPFNTDYKRAMHLRRNSKINIYNSILLGYPIGLLIDGTSTQANAISNELKIYNTIMSGMKTFFTVPDGQTWTVQDERAWYMNTNRKNDTLATNDAMMITDPFNLAAPNFLPMANSPVLNKSSWMSIHELPLLDVELSAYPNPASGEFSLIVSGLKKPALLLISDAYGQLVMQQAVKPNQGTQHIQLNMDGKASGVYFVGLTAGNERRFTRILLN